MMRNYILFFFYIGVFFSLSSQVKAQYVIIPDANFRTYLEAAFPSCMQGGMMDTTCTNIVNATNIDVRSRNISDLTGVQYFDQLALLECRNNQLTFLPPLPHNLIDLSCPANQLFILPSLPISLEYLDCSTNNIASLPVLPSSMTNLYCGWNQLTLLPQIPLTLTVLWCNNNYLKILPSLPGLINELCCSYNQLANLPSLPLPLMHLICDGNQLTSLPYLPPQLTQLSCAKNQLTELPNLPALLSQLECGSNALTLLPPLPASLFFLGCKNNQLVTLPYLPGNLTYLVCTTNQIMCLPLLPNSLITLMTDSLCRPNTPNSIRDNVPVNSPLCSALTFTHTRVCADDSMEFNLMNANCQTFMWNFDDPAAAGYNTSTLQNPKHLFSHPGTFNVKLITPATVISKTVIVDKLSQIDFGNGYSMCPDDDVVLDAGPYFTSYIWQDGSVSQTYTVKKAGMYSVKATNMCGVVSDSIQLNSYELVFPNLFTPNKDIYNEYFEIVGLNGDAGSLQVYNSWGSEVYHNDHYHNDWNATNLPDGVYYYSFTLKSCPIEKGWVQITR